MDFVYSVPQPFNLKATIKTHGWFQLAPFYWNEENSELVWATKLSRQSPVLVILSEQGPSKKFAQINFHTDTDLSADQHQMLVGKFHHVFNLDLDLTEFYKICAQYPVLEKVEIRGMGRLMRAESLFEDIFKSICGTNIQWKQAVKIINTISQAGEKVPGTENHVFPSPQQILEKGETYLKEVGRVGYRSSYLIDVARRFDLGEKFAKAVESGEMSGKDLVKYFLDFRGIGKATARYLAALYGNFEDMAIDSLVISYMSKNHFNGETPTEKQIEEIYTKFGTWKYLAYWMEFIISDGWIPDN